jgi:hypothetical protein
VLPLLVAVVVAATQPLVPGRPGELRGTVTRSDGTAIKRFTVNAMQFSDPRGAFKILVPPEGTFRVVVRADGLAPSVIHVQGAEGKRLVMPDITLGKGEDVVGEVVDAETGKPVSEARVALADPAQIERLRLIRGEKLTDVAVTGKGGWFKIPRAPRCLALLVVRHPGYLPEFVPVNTRDRLPAIALHRGGGVAGSIRDARGMPVAGVRVLALSEEARDGAEAVADRFGRYKVEGLRPGHYRIVALPPGGAVETPAVVSDGSVASAAIEVKGRTKQMDLPDLIIGDGRATGPALASSAPARP